jgi:hypothetical protein
MPATSRDVVRYILHDHLSLELLSALAGHPGPRCSYGQVFVDHESRRGFSKVPLLIEHISEMFCSVQSRSLISSGINLFSRIFCHILFALLESGLLRASCSSAAKFLWSRHWCRLPCKA